MQKSNIRKKDELREYTLTDNLEISPGVHYIAFQRDFDFEPGQVVKIGMDKQHPPRIYSLCSGNKQKETKILFNIKDDGFLTPKLAACTPGEKIFVSAPYGSFTGSTDEAWWIATGTGIAPFYSMLKSGLVVNKTLIHGVRNLNQFYFEDEWEEALDKKYIRCCSGESACNVISGRVTDYLRNISKLPDVNYYICGQALAVVEIRDLLIEKGIAYENILAEIYF